MQKLKDEEIQELSVLKNQAASVMTALGELEYQKTILELQIAEQKSLVKDIKIKETGFINRLQQNYGNITLNLDTGEFS